MKIKLLSAFFITLILLLSSNSFGQSDGQSTKKFGIRFNSFYDFQLKQTRSFHLLRIAPVITLDYKNHNFYLGPQYVRFFRPKSIPNERYEKEGFGVNFGYRKYFSELIQHLRWFGQFDYAIYQIKYEEFQKGEPFSTENSITIAHNSILLGIDYRAIKNLSCFIAVGIGSLDGFFMLIDDFTISTTFGLEYKF